MGIASLSVPNFINLRHCTAHHYIRQYRGQRGEGGDIQTATYSSPHFQHAFLTIFGIVGIIPDTQRELVVYRRSIV